MKAAPVLIVEDDSTIREVMADALRDEGYEVALAQNGEEALTVVQRDQPGLILLDMRLPVLDGWGFARRLKELGLDVPIVIVTATHNTEVWAEEIGAVGFLAKPFDLTDLLDVVERHSAGTQESA